MIERIAGRQVESLLEENQAVALIGPHQSGSTTLAKDLASAGPVAYYNVELDTDRLRLDIEWALRSVI